MKIYYNLTSSKSTNLFVVLFLCVFFGYGQKDLTGLYFCNDYYDFDKIWPVDNKSFLSWDVNNHINFIILYSLESNHPIDTFELGATDRNYLHNLNWLGEDQILVQCLSNSYTLRVGQEGLVLEDNVSTFDKKFGLLIYRTATGEKVYYDYSKGKEVAYNVVFQDGTLKNFSFGKQKVNLKSPFDLGNASLIYTAQEQFKSVVPSPNHNEYVIIDWSKKQLNKVVIDEFDKKEFYFIFHDGIKNHFYLSRFDETSKNVLYRLDPFKMQLVGIRTDEQPIDFINDDMIIISKTEVDDISKLKITCHYSYPLIGEPQESILLEEVNIGSN